MALERSRTHGAPIVDAQVVDTQVTQVLADTHRLLAMAVLLAGGASLLSSVLVSAAPGAVLLLTNPFVTIGVFWFLMWRLHKICTPQPGRSASADASKGLLYMLGASAWLGFSLGPLLLLTMQINGSGPIINAAACTGVTLLVASVAGRRFPGVLGMGRMMMVGILVAFVLGIINLLFLQNTGLAMAVSLAFGFISSGLIAWHVASVVHGGERNHILVAMGLFVALYNLFVVFLSFFNSRD